MQIKWRGRAGFLGARHRFVFDKIESPAYRFSFMQNDHIDIYQVAHLARMELSAEEAALFQSQLDPVLEHVNQLSKLDLDAVEPTAHTRPIFNVLREDEPALGLEKQEALSNAPHHANGMFSVTKVLDS